MILIYSILNYLITIIWWVIIVQAIMSWLLAFNVINTHNEMVRSVWQALRTMTDPLYNPIRKVMPDFGALDLSPIVVLLLLNILQRFVLPYVFGPFLYSSL